MAKYISGKQKNLKIGISSYSENLTSLEVIGNVGIGTTNSTSALFVVGDARVTGVITATTFSGNVNAGVGTITNLTGTAATITTFNSTNGTITNGTITNLTGTAGTITTLNSTNGTITNGIVTNLTGTSGTITTFNSTTGTITNLSATNINVSGIVTATNGFVSTANTTPIQIQLVGNLLTFQAVGIGSTTFTLF